mmetsp:Transcript_7278/g.11623  ORF Transcript_7278/g.11623 Transcript_7278/m.11623 type:complete len:744 (+) Transcript_7278:214-2445(+)|eukprot:CAMPEP_0203786668 /NCGR_PEP_ID=MMETSP0100_2-20121128/1759_1 /ASSEMBLY_ACC=CAM_ASM_000210 /TAXON_ID=96639 /ORGANISM=" , Strain NY0313808BC1" /LENGTH=743 /DNA_ID=CAMNT_0050689005 /DNA_START=127 /DNA_END=2358 /DNA_ORIENTATION=-
MGNSRSSARQPPEGNLREEKPSNLAAASSKHSMRSKTGSEGTIQLSGSEEVTIQLSASEELQDDSFDGTPVNKSPGEEVVVVETKPAVVENNNGDSNQAQATPLPPESEDMTGFGVHLISTLVSVQEGDEEEEQESKSSRDGDNGSKKRIVNVKISTKDQNDADEKTIIGERRPSLLGEEGKHRSSSVDGLRGGKGAKPLATRRRSRSVETKHNGVAVTRASDTNLRGSRTNSNVHSPKNAAATKRRAGSVSKIINGNRPPQRRRRMIGDYEVLQFLGRGSQGTVLKCENMQTGQVVAIKTVTGGSLMVAGTVMNGRNRGGLRSRAGLSGVSKAVSKEIALLKKVKHPNLVRLLSVIDSPPDRDIHLVFEYVSGGPLRQLSDNLLLKNSGLPLPEDEARCFFRQLCSAVRYLHFHRIVHRDIKPSNLIIDREHRVLKLTDLGIACQTTDSKASKVLGNDDDLLASSMVVGTRAFLPPEYYKIKRKEEEQQELMLVRCYEASQGVLDSAMMESGNWAARDDFVPARQYFPGRAADVWATGVTLYAFMYGGIPHMQNPRPPRFSGTNRFVTFSSSSSDVSGSMSQSSPQPPDRSMHSRSGKQRKSISADEMQERIINNPLRFPGTGLGTSSRLRNLLGRMLDKDPRKRLTISEVCSHQWVCKYEPMPPLSGEQKHSIRPSKQDQDSAINRPNVFKQLSRHFRRIRSKAHIFVSYQASREDLKEEESSAKSQSFHEKRAQEEELYE